MRDCSRHNQRFADDFANAREGKVNERLRKRGGGKAIRSQYLDIAAESPTESSAEEKLDNQ